MGILPMRNLKVNFTIPYDYTGMSMVAHKEKAKGFSSLEDFNRPEVMLAAKLGATIGHGRPEAHAPGRAAPVRLRGPRSYQELLNGRVHAAVGNAPTPAFYAVEHPDTLFMPLAENFTKEPIGFAVRKGDHDTLNFFDNWIRLVTAEGWLKERKHYWFETKDWETLLK